MVFRSWNYTDSIMMDVVYSDKVATRFSEALWVRFQPSRHHADLKGLTLAKINAFIKPDEVVRPPPVQKGLSVASKNERIPRLPSMLKVNRA
jgi:hypothetical protein